MERFVNNNRQKIARGEKFSQLSEEERNEIIEFARRLANEGQSLSEVTRRIATKMGRSVETIRYTLKHFDEKHPNLAVFPDQAGPLTEESKTRVYQQYRRGTSVEVLAKRHGRTRASVYRIINEMRAKLLAELPLDFIDNPDFHNPRNDVEFTGSMPDPETATRRSKVPSGLPPYLASLYEVPLLTREQEQHLFRKFNYLKCKAAKLRDQVDVSRAKSRDMDEIEHLYQQAVEVKNQIVQANLRLVVSIAKRHVNSTDDFFTLISDGNMSLIRAAEKFDYARGNKFSTYASWAIMKNFARTIPEEYKIRDRFRTGGEEMFTAAPDERSDQYEQEARQNVREKQINLILSKLDEREQKIIISRFGLDHSNEPQTLKEVGADLGVTKERVRQIEARALHKLRAAAKEERIELPD